MKQKFSKVFLLFCLIMFTLASGSVFAQDETYSIGSYRGRLKLGPYVSGYVDNDHNLWTWGDNSYGQLGDGGTESKNTPEKVLSDVLQVGFGSRHTAALKTDGTFWVWGTNKDGELGTGDNEDHFTPVQIMENIAAFNVNGYNTAVVTNDGELYIWGDNFYGQIGNGTDVDSLEPVRVMENVKDVNLGYYHSAAITNEGDLYLWGDNEFGQIGDNTTDDHLTPVKILSDVVEVSLGMDHSAAIKNDGTFWAWGENEYGQLGDGTEIDKHAPEQIMDGVVMVRLGYNHSAVIKSDGSLWTWGINNYGQLGDGTINTSDVPIRVMSDVAQVNLGHYHTGVITNDGTCYVWGDNTFGQLGNGTNETSVVPVEIFTGSIPWGISSITLEPETDKLTTLAGGTNSTTVRATVIPGTFGEAIQWSVSPENIASLETRGSSAVVTAKEEGVATVVATVGGIFAKTTITISNDPAVGEATISASTPDSFTVTAYNVETNPALSGDKGIDHVTMFCWSAPDQSDISKKTAELDNSGNYDATFTVNNTPRGEYFINANNIHVEVYASDSPQGEGSLIATGIKTWKRNTESSGHNLAYIGYSQNQGFNTKTVYDGLLAGTEGKALHLEGFRVSSLLDGVEVEADTHLADIGWVEGFKDGTYAGTMWENRPIEAVRLHLTGENASKYDLQYRVHARDIGWLDWVNTDEQAGTTGEARPIEGIEIEIVPKSN